MATPDLHLRGRAASPGLAMGRAVVLLHQLPTRSPSGSPRHERDALRRAINNAIAELGSFASGAAEDAAGILSFQFELLQDSALARPAFDAIERGEKADDAWRAALGAEALGYADSNDPHFAARAADLRDIETRVLGHLVGTRRISDIAASSVVFAEDLLPTDFLSIDWGAGGAIVLSFGSEHSHVALLARARGVPMIVGAGPLPRGMEGEALVDADAGLVLVAPRREERASFQRRLRQQARTRALQSGGATADAVTRDGTRIAVHLNISDLGELERISPQSCDGIGLVRTEFLFGAQALPDENAQHAAYVHILHWAQGRPVIIRTLDAGADKPLPGRPHEPNAFLGTRGVRLSLRDVAPLRVQLRALARAAAHGPLGVLIPMVTLPSELAQVRTIVEEELRALGNAGIAAARPRLGMMVEVPAAALTIERFDAEFYSIGTNDLVQYLMAAARDAPAVAALTDPQHPAVLELIDRIVSCGRRAGREVSLCGDAASDARFIGSLLACGLRSLSVPPAALPAVKAAIRCLDLRFESGS